MKKKYIGMLLALLLPTGFVACSDDGVPEKAPTQVTPPSEEDPKEEPEPESPEVTAETEMNEVIDACLSELYLWNGEYNGMTRDLTIPYVDGYENFMRTTLLSMTTNTLDKKRNSAGGYNLYSYIEREEKKTGSRNVRAGGVDNGIEKEDKIKSYGFCWMHGVNFINTGSVGLVVQSVYPDSPASAMGVKRGTYIFKVNGTTIDQSNYASLALSLLAPQAQTVTLTVNDGNGARKDVTLMAAEIDPSPVLLNTVIEEGSHKIGYLVYDAFDAAYDNELLDVVTELKSAGVTDLVLDLRYNGGGHVNSSMMLTACIVGSQCRDKLYMYYRYNDTRMRQVEKTKRDTGNGYDPEAKYFYENFMYDDYFGVNLADYALGLERVYTLVTSSSASASEVLINVLRGLDFPVEVIGGKTNGKNVGMEVVKFDKGDYTYELAPITFQYYNAKRETILANGLKVDYEVSDWDDGYIDFGERNEPLLSKAIELITGQSSSSSLSRSVAGVPLRILPVGEALDGGHHPRGTLVLRKDR